MTSVHHIPGLFATSHLIETPEALFLVDAGFLGHGRAILRTIRRLGRSPAELRFALITHAHLDHFGGLAEVQAARPGLEAGCHPLHATTLAEGGLLVSPSIRPGWGTYVALAHRTMSMVPARGASDVRPLEDGSSLHDIGLPGRVVHTPGHSEGCVSLLLDDGTAFVGDLMQGRRLPTLRPQLPSMACDVASAHASWRHLLALGARRFEPAHAAPFSAEELRATMRREGVPRSVYRVPGRAARS